MTEKLYYKDQYIEEFTAEIVNIIEKDKEFHIQLDKTAFYPGGGGQPCDIGVIEQSIITNVYEKDGIIYHVSNKKPIKIHRAKSKIDWELRLDGMQQHLGQHILSAVLFKNFNCNTVGFHLGKDTCTIDLDKRLKVEEFEEAEELANKIIFENINVEFLSLSKAELKKLSIRKIPHIDEATLRFVKIKDLDLNACCGVHTNSTLEVQMIKIKRIENYKSKIKVEFLCGRRAILDSINKHKFSSRICKKLNCSEDEVLTSMEKMASDYNYILAENKNLKSQVADYEVQNLINNAENIKGIRIIKNIFTDRDMKYINLLSTKLTAHPKVIVLYALKSEGMANLLFTCSKDIKDLNMSDLLKDAITLIDGRGGGSSVSAQGGGKGISNLEVCIEYAYSKVNNALK